ncbi:hypothetical protein [Aquibacillus kalidii]|uniref:hypothetical protein n=1 Tax=Aquibacillus kalidii TaxID=2762597 RepID=UPI001646DE88|nr:hypothetical protein [Aquibacillus kalidii]
MGLFVNKYDHPDVFKNECTIKEPNQGIYKKNYLTDLVEEQQKMNEELNKLKKSYNQQTSNQSYQWNNLLAELEDLRERNDAQVKFEQDALEWFSKLAKESKMMQNEQGQEKEVTQHLVEEVNKIADMNHEIVQYMQSQEAKNQHLTSEINEILGLQEQVVSKISTQADDQTTIQHRLDNQEALMEKLSRQVTDFRSILYERTNHLAEKIENSLNLTSSYLYKVLSRSDKPLTFFYEETKNEKSTDSSSN